MYNNYGIYKICGYSSNATHKPEYTGEYLCGNTYVKKTKSYQQCGTEVKDLIFRGKGMMVRE